MVHSIITGRQTRLLLVLALLTSVFTILPATSAGGAPPTLPGDSSTVFINEIHYDNTGGDTGEFIEIAGPVGTAMSDWQIVLYNGNGGGVYNTVDLSESLDQNESNGYGFRIYAIASIQNGAPDGVALVDDGTPVQFLSYEGSFEATDGPLVGVLSTDIGVAEPGDTPVGHSLQLGGTGDTYGNFANGSWQAAAAETPGLVNTGQTFSATVLPNATCPADFAITEGDGAIKALSASDADGTVVDISAVTVPDPSGHIHVTDLVAASGVGATATANLTVDGGGDVPAGVYEVEITATNDDGSPEIGTCSVTITVYPTELTPVYDIQGDGSDSPLEGEWVRTFGVVTAEFQTVGGGGFFP